MFLEELKSEQNPRTCRGRNNLLLCSHISKFKCCLWFYNGMYNHTTEKCQKGLLAKIDTQKVRHLFDKLQALLPRNPFFIFNIQKVERKKIVLSIARELWLSCCSRLPRPQPETVTGIYELPCSSGVLLLTALKVQLQGHPRPFFSLERRSTHSGVGCLTVAPAGCLW